MELSPPDADVLKPPWDNECVLCFGALSDQPLTDRAGCDSCQKEWCVECDLRWKLTRTQASLAPTCPFCRTSLNPPRTPSPDPIVRVLDPPPANRRLPAARPRPPPPAVGRGVPDQQRRSLPRVLLSDTLCLPVPLLPRLAIALPRRGGRAAGRRAQRGLAQRVWLDATTLVVYNAENDQFASRTVAAKRLLYGFFCKKLYNNK